MDNSSAALAGGQLDCRTDLSTAELPVLLVVAILLNGVSIFVLVRIRPAVNTIHHFLVTTLAANDLVTTLLFTVMWIGCVTVCGKIGGDLGCSLLGWCATAMVIWSAWVVVVMSGVRYLAVVKPLYYRTHVTFHSVKCALAVTIVLTFAHLVFPFTGLVEPYKLYTENFVCAYDFAPGSGGLQHRVLIGVASSVGMSTTGLILFFNGRIVSELRNNGRVASSQNAAASQRRDRRNSMANLHTKAVAIGYCICYAPFSIRLMYDVAHNSPDQDGVRHSVTMSLLFLSPILNPLITAAYNKRFRQYIAECIRQGLKKCGLLKPANRSSPLRTLNSSNGNVTLVTSFP